jgi:hypothetical protein
MATEVKVREKVSALKVPKPKIDYKMPNNIGPIHKALVKRFAKGLEKGRIELGSKEHEFLKNTLEDVQNTKKSESPGNMLSNAFTNRFFDQIEGIEGANEFNEMLVNVSLWGSNIFGAISDNIFREKNKKESDKYIKYAEGFKKILSDVTSAANANHPLEPEKMLEFAKKTFNKKIKKHFEMALEKGFLLYSRTPNLAEENVDMLAVSPGEIFMQILKENDIPGSEEFLKKMTEHREFNKIEAELSVLKQAFGEKEELVGKVNEHLDEISKLRDKLLKIDKLPIEEQAELLNNIEIRKEALKKLKEKYKPPKK